MGNVRWNEKEDKTMREYYPKEGTEVIHRLAGRTKQAIWLHAMKLGLTVEPETVSRNISMHKEDGWTDEEKKLLEEHYVANKGNMGGIIPRHTESACYRKSAGIRGARQKPRWTDDEIAFLKGHLDDYPSTLLPSLPRHTTTAIGTMQSRLRGDKKELPKEKWTDEELGLLRQHLDDKPSDLVPLFPNRTKRAIKDMRTKLRKERE